MLTRREIAQTLKSESRGTQKDGASVFVSRAKEGRFNFVVQNKDGKMITNGKNFSEKSLDRLARKYGWEGDIK